MDEDEFTSCNRVPKMPLKSQRLRNPFLLKIDPESLNKDNYIHGITLNIVCECSFWLFSFWAVKIKEFHQKLALDWLTIKNQLIDNHFVDDNVAYHCNDPELYKDEYNKIVHRIKAPENFDSNFFKVTPRDRYPLAVILLLNDDQIEDQIQSNDIVMLSTIIHLKDSLVPLETSIIAQYIKRKSGIVLNLQDLYVCSENNETNMPYCIICLDNHIDRALLPCKHACVCSQCLDRISTCPLCRCTIQNFLLINQPICRTDQSGHEIHQSEQNDMISENSHNESDHHHHPPRRHSGFFGRVQKFLGL